MIRIHKNELMTAFNDPTFAWELLEWEIAIEMNESLSGTAISKLLQLYMRGLEKMNYLLDARESYFKNKLTALMMKANVVNSLTKPPPMTKKEKPLEVVAHKEKGVIGKVEKLEKEIPVISTRVRQSTSLILSQKKREMEMRLAYEAAQNKRENLGLLYHEHLAKLQKFNSRVGQLVEGQEQRLRDRITLRKLKTATYGSRQDDLKDRNGKQTDFQENGEEAAQLGLDGRGKIIRKMHRKARSLQERVMGDLIATEERQKRVRKLTEDWTPRLRTHSTLSQPLIM